MQLRIFTKPVLARRFRGLPFAPTTAPITAPNGTVTGALHGALIAALILGPAQAAACAWAGGAYSFSERGVYGDFTVNDDCTQMVWDRSSDGPETTALTRSKDGWKGALEKVEVELLENGHNLRLTDRGGPTRQTKASREN